MNIQPMLLGTSIDIPFLITVLIVFIAFIFIMRAIGAWMLRIDEVVKYQKETNELLREWKDEQSTTAD